MSKIFVAYKPTGLSSNQFLGRIKRKYKTKKAGYSGTLDPFAKGVLIVALGNHTRLFRFLNKAPKSYRATLWLGAHSPTLDIEQVEKVDETQEINTQMLSDTIRSFIGELTYTPPIFCAKKINGQRAYDLARRGEEVILQELTATISDAKLIHYCHPFVTFEATVSEGTYIRSLGLLIAQKLGLQSGALTALERLSEGQFFYEDEKALNVKTSLNMPQNWYEGDPENLFYGRKLNFGDFKIQVEGTYWIDNNDTITIISIENETISYLLNKVDAC